MSMNQLICLILPDLHPISNSSPVLPSNRSHEPLHARGSGELIYVLSYESLKQIHVY